MKTHHKDKILEGVFQRGEVILKSTGVELEFTNNFFNSVTVSREKKSVFFNNSKIVYTLTVIGELNRRGKRYILKKRMAGLNDFNTTILTEREISYVEKKLNLEMFV